MVEDERMGSTLTCRSTSMNLTVYVRLFITPFSICLVGVAQLTLGRTVSVSLPCPVRWLVNLCLHCSCTFSFSLCVTKSVLLSTPALFVILYFLCLIFDLSCSPSCSEICFFFKKSVCHQHVVTTFSFYQHISGHGSIIDRTPIFLYLNLNGSLAVQRCCSSWFLQCNWSING